MPATPAPRLALTLLSALVLSACSTPKIARWSAPPAVGAPATNLDAGRADAAAARKAYQDVVDQYVQDQANVGNGLLGLGLLATVLAASTAHRDAVVGAGFLGGSVYAYGQFNLSKQRALVHQAGVEAVDCALRAVAPLAMTAAEQKELGDGITALEADGRVLSAALDRLRQARAGAGALDAARAAAVTAVLDAAAAAQDGARKTQQAGRQLARQVRGAGEQLSQTVRKIDNTVARATLESLPDLSALPKVIASAATYAGQVVPGVDGFFTEALSRRARALGAQAQAGTLGAQTVQDKALDAAMLQAQKATDALLDSAARVQAIAASYESAQAADALRDCGVTDVAFPLRASRDKLNFPGGTAETKTLVLSGGTKPYVVELADSPVPGLSVKGPAPFDSRLQVSTTAELKTPASFTVLVMDASNPMKTVTIPVDVGVTEPTGPAPEAGHQPAPAADTLDGLATRLNTLGRFKLSDELTLVLTGAGVTLPAGGGSANVKLRCEPAKPAQCLPQAKAREALLKAAGLPASSELGGKLKLQGPQACLCAP